MGIKLLDCPGMVLASGNMTDASVALRNAIKVESLTDPITPVMAIMGRVPREHLMLQYGVGTFSDASEFLAKLAISLGKLRKGGVPDRETAARMVLGDWNSGKIKYCTHPPEEEKQTSSEIVTQFASEFSLNELERGEKMDLQNLPMVRPSEMVNVEAGQINDKAAEVEEDDEEDMEKEKDDPLFKLEGNLKLEKRAKLLAKKNRKDRRRGERVAETLSNQMENVFSQI